MTAFFLIGLALMLGDMIPWSIRILMFVGGVYSLFGPWLRYVPGRGGSYSGGRHPYQAQDNMLGDDYRDDYYPADDYGGYDDYGDD